MNNSLNGRKMVSVQMELPEGFGDTEMIRELKQTVNELRALVSNIHAPISFNEQQLADYFGISKLSLERLRRSGKIGYKRVAGKIHYTRQHIEQFLNSK